MLVTEFIKFIAGAVLLSVSSIIIIKSLVRVGRYFRLSDFTVSFILMAAATSLPELSVTINSAIANTPELTIGAIIGSNIADLTIIAGVMALFARRINVTGIIQKRDATYMTFVSIIMLLLIGDRSLSRADGVILLLIYGFYIYTLYKQQQYFENKRYRRDLNNLIANLIIFAIATGMLIWSADIVVDASKTIGHTLSIPLILIGFFVVAFGTSLPELVFEINAIKSDKQDLAMGDLIGSIVTNSALIIGITAIISPITFENFELFDTGIIFFIISLIFFNIFMWTKKELSWKEGLMLLSIYTAFLFSEGIIGAIR